MYWAAAHGKGGQPASAVIDVEGIERIIPVLIEDSKKAPARSPVR